ncbi:YL1-domain-containing protein [Corynespora cassiicola Philippines]|uniref:YL1-domain-containing protein n=1 Tax=Corynespora cassiicola Philippines TaxID=1448308 RepID=A0A2T2P920_CORCC|nr:YL1-domain-containing protein [Corynespora cassiicola Philippines]
MDIDSRPQSDGHGPASASDGESEPDAPVEFLAVSRSRRSNAGNRMSTLLAQSVEEEEWGDEWEEAPNEEDFVGDDANNQDDFNLDSSSSEEDDDAAADDDAGEKELRKAERQERIKKRKTATNPFAARLAAARKKVKLDVPRTESPSSSTPRPKKKSERASWIPTEEDGPTRTSSRKQTIANKQHTLAKLKEKDRRRDDTLAMMKAAEARKAKDEPKPMSQTERLAEAARVERVNSKSLHRWEEAEEQRAAERQAKIDAMKNRQIDGPFVRFYSGPAIWVDERIKYTGKDAPKLEDLEEKLNKDVPSQPQPAEDGAANTADLKKDVAEPQADPSQNQTQAVDSLQQQSQLPQPKPSQASHTQPSFGAGNDPFMGSNAMSYPSSIMFAPPQNPDSFLFGIDQYAGPQSHPHREELPPNPFAQHENQTMQPNLSHSPFSQSHPSLNDPLVANGSADPQEMLSQFQRPAVPPPPPRRREIRRALRNLLILSSFPNLEAPQPSRRSTAALIKDKDRSALIQLSTTLFGWSQTDATNFINAMLSAPKSTRGSKVKEAALARNKEICPVSNNVARYRDPETGIAYSNARAFGVLRGVVGGGFVWSGDLGCYVGGRAKPLEIPGGNKSKGFLGMAPAMGVPKRFMEMPKPTRPPPPVPPQEQPAPSSSTPAAADKVETPTPAPAPSNTNTVANTVEVAQSAPKPDVKPDVAMT